VLPWCHAPSVLAHPLLDGRTALLSRDLATTTRSVAEFDFRDAVAWQALVSRWEELAPSLMQTLLTPFPPLRAGAGLARRLWAHFHGEGAALLLAGNAMHTNLGSALLPARLREDLDRFAWDGATLRAFPRVGVRTRRSVAVVRPNDYC
jgi:phytoene dehydrogenase-like protein